MRMIAEVGRAPEPVCWVVTEYVTDCHKELWSAIVLHDKGAMDVYACRSSIFMRKISIPF